MWVSTIQNLLADEKYEMTAPEEAQAHPAGARSVSFENSQRVVVVPLAHSIRKHFLLCCIIALGPLLTGAETPNIDSIEYSRTYAGQLFTKPTYEGFLGKSLQTKEKIIAEVASYPPVERALSADPRVGLFDFLPLDAGVYREYQMAEPFFRSLMSVERPDFETVAAEDVNSDPISVLISQVWMAYEGKRSNISLPDDFRNLLFLGLVAYPEWPVRLAEAGGGQYVDEELAVTTARLFLEATKKLEKEHFQCEHYDLLFACKSYDAFWAQILGYLVIMCRHDTEYASDYLEGLLLLEYDFTRMLWDRQWNAQIRIDSGCPENENRGHSYYANDLGVLSDAVGYANEKVGKEGAFWEAVSHEIWKSFEVLESGFMQTEDVALQKLAREGLEKLEKRLSRLRPCSDLQKRGEQEKSAKMTSTQDPTRPVPVTEELSNARARQKYYLLLFEFALKDHDIPAMADLCDLRGLLEAHLDLPSEHADLSKGSLLVLDESGVGPG